MKILLITSLSVLLYSCANNNPNVNSKEAFTPPAQSSNISINEVSFHSSQENEFGKKADWIELYNNSENELLLTEGDWAISDNPGKAEKFILPETKIPANGHLLIWCDKSDQAGSDIHANFKVSSKGETLSLYYKDEISDQVQFDSAISMFDSYARIKDGSDIWQETYSSTPESPNNLYMLR
jgi:hypothetical protein